MVRNPLFHLLLIAILGLIVYSNTFDVPFQFDDVHCIANNPAVKDFKCNVKMSRYVSYLTFALNYKLHGLEVRGFHAVNLLIHIITAMLVYWLVGLTFRTPFMEGSSLREKSVYVALATGLLFVCHPIQTQAVTYIVQRFASLAALFYLLSLVLYIRYRLGTTHSHSPLKGGGGMAGSVLLYLASLLFALLAMKSKETAFTLPLAIVLYEFIFFRGGLRKRLLHLGPLFLTILIIPLTLVSLKVSPGEALERIAEATRVQTGMSRLEYLFTEFSVITTYVRLLFLPVGQNLDYDYPLYRSFFEPQVFLSFLFLLGILGLGIYMLGRSRKEVAGRLIAFGIFWFFLTLSVESSIIPIVDVIFEHRVYLPSVGAFIAVVAGACLLVNQLKNKRMRKAAAYAFVATLVVLSTAAYARNAVWRSETSLWEDVVRKSPLKGRGYVNLGKAYNEAGMVDKAIRHLEMAIDLSPEAPMAHNNLGIAYRSKGMADRAIKHLQIAIKLKPNFISAYINLGNAYYTKGMFGKAMENYNAVLYYKPDHAEAHYNLGNAYRGKGLTDKAMEHYNAAIKLDPGNADAYNNLGLAYFSMGMADEALERYETALKLNPDYENAHFNMGEAYFSKGLVDKAIEHYRAFLGYRPDYAEAHYNLGLAYEDRGLAGKAVEHYRRALALDPDHEEAQESLRALNEN